jgi:hypothetical protein
MSDHLPFVTAVLLMRLLAGRRQRWHILTSIDHEARRHAMRGRGAVTRGRTVLHGCLTLVMDHHCERRGGGGLATVV